MAAPFTANVQLEYRVGSQVAQADANQKLRNRLRSALTEAQGQLQALAPEGVTAPTVEEIAGFSTAQARPWVARLVRAYIRNLSDAADVKQADTTHVKPIRERAADDEDVG